MACRRIAWMAKSLKPAPSHKTVQNISQNLNGLVNLEVYNRTLLSPAISQSHFFLPCYSTLSKDKIHPEDSLSVSKNFETEEDKRLMNIAMGIHTEVIKAEQKLEEVEILLEETIAELKGFMSFLKWDFHDVRLNNVKDILDDVDSRFTESFAALDKLLASFEGRKFKIEDILIDICCIKLRTTRCLEESKRKGKLLNEMIERLIRCEFYISFLSGGR